jgi:hypothetical protein
MSKIGCGRLSGRGTIEVVDLLGTCAMSRRWVREPAVAVLMLMAAIMSAATGAAEAGPGEAGRGPRPAAAPGLDLKGVDYVVLIWYRRDDPLGTFQHQTYDVREGQYTPAVDAWLREMRERHPRYVVRVHRVDLDRERGATEQLKVGSVIHRELLLTAAQAGIVVGAPMPIGPGLSAAQGRAPRTFQPAMPGANDRSYLNPSPPSFPVPMPYPRPHP